MKLCVLLEQTVWINQPDRLILNLSQRITKIRRFIVVQKRRSKIFGTLLLRNFRSGSLRPLSSWLKGQKGKSLLFKKPSHAVSCLKVNYTYFSLSLYLSFFLVGQAWLGWAQVQRRSTIEPLEDTVKGSRSLPAIPTKYLAILGATKSGKI